MVHSKSAILHVGFPIHGSGFARICLLVKKNACPFAGIERMDRFSIGREFPVHFFERKGK